MSRTRSWTKVDLLPIQISQNALEFFKNYVCSSLSYLGKSSQIIIASNVSTNWWPVPMLRASHHCMRVFLCTGIIAFKEGVKSYSREENGYY